MPDAPVKVTENGVTIAVWVVPGASRSAVDGLHGEHVKVRVSSPPEGGRANAEVERLLSGLLGSPVRIVRGMKTRSKVFEVIHGDVDVVREKLGL